jgi:DNA-binding transcriptional LysR family regulator
VQLRQLEYVIALARERHFGRAAAACHVSQPSLSGGIRALEAELGVPIVVRGRSYGGLTPEGERVVAWAHRLLADAEGLREDLASMRGALTGRLRLGAIPTALPIASALSATVAALHPGLSITVLSLASREIERQLLEFEIDAGITYLDNESLHGVRGVPLAQERYVLYAHHDSPEAARTSMTWHEAADLPLCLLTQTMQNRRIIDAAFTTAGSSPSPRIESDDIVPLWEHVADGRWCGRSRSRPTADNHPRAPRRSTRRRLALDAPTQGQGSSSIRRPIAVMSSGGTPKNSERPCEKRCMAANRYSGIERSPLPLTATESRPMR